MLRYDVDNSLKKFNEINIPIKIVSGGVGNLIDLIIHHLGIEAEVISNYVQFDEEGKSKCFSNPVINITTKQDVLAH